MMTVASQCFSACMGVMLGGLFLSSQANAYSSGPPFLPTGRTGAPGHSTCASCHTSSSGGGGSVQLNFSGVTEYEAESRYTMEVTVSDVTQLQFGFQMVARDADNDTTSGSAGTWTAGTSTEVFGTTEPHIAHKPALLGAGSASYAVEWTAPSPGVGDVTFYVAAIAGNQNGNNRGDRLYLNSLTISEAAGEPVMPTLTDAERTQDGSFAFTLNGEDGVRYAVEHWDEATTMWQVLETVTLAGASVVITDEGAMTDPVRLYRATKMP